MRYRRVLLKMSGESLKGDHESGIDPAQLVHYAREVKRLTDDGVQVALVVGGGNIVRGSELAKTGTERATADYMGMLGTVINGLALQDALEKIGVYTRCQTAIKMSEVAEPYIRRRAVRHLEKGRVVIFAAGTGNPYFSTDTAAVLRAIEMEANVILKATKVDGVYTSDPEKDDTAEFIEHISYLEVMTRELQVMDAAAISLCKDNHLPVIVLNIRRAGAILSAIEGERIGTLVS